MKKKIMFTALSIAFIFCFLDVSKLQAEDQLIFGAQSRLRYEFMHNFNQKYYGENPGMGKSNDGFLLGRFKAGIDYTQSDKIHVALWMQDSEAWDMALSDDAFYNSKTGFENNPNKDRFELSDAYVEFKNLWDFPLYFKAGRQRLSYGDKRVFGPGEWGNSGKWIWDAASISYRFEKGFVDVYYGRNIIHEPDIFSLIHRHLYESAGLYGQITLPSYLLKITFEPFMMTKSDDHDDYTSEDGITGDFDAFYTGFRFFRKNLKGADFDFTYIWQFGDYSHDNIKAYGYHILLGYNFDIPEINSRLSLEYSFASGDSDPYDGDRETFDAAFGARDKMYGRMNLFQWMNLKDAQINLEVRPLKKCYIKAEFHKFYLAEEKDAWYLNAKKYRDKTGKSGDEVGEEFDITAKIDLPYNHEIQFGYGHFRPDEFAKNKASDKQADWVFLQWQYTFSTSLL